MNLQEIIEEINKLKNPSKHKSALDIFNLLDNNSKLFLTKIEEEDFTPLINAFEKLAYADPKEYATNSYQNDYERSYGSLCYQLNKIT